MSSAAPAATAVARVGGANANLLTWQKRAAARKLATGPLFLGEHHERAAARAVLLDLIAEGSVKRLFIEAAEEATDIPGYTNISDFLRKNAGNDITSVDGWSELDPVIAYIDNRNANAIPLREVIVTAVAAGVAVTFFDNHVSMSRTSAKAMVGRNSVMAHTFLEHGGLEPGSVALVGSMHFSVSYGNHWETTVAGACGLGFDRLIDLSRFA